MIPLIYAAKSGELLVEDVIAIKSITPSFNEATRELIVEYKFNLDNFIKLKIKLNEFDQPKSIYVIHENKYEPVTKETQEYLIKNRYAVIKIKYDEIVKLVNNTIKKEDVKNIYIRAYLFNTKDRSFRIDKFNLLGDDDPYIHMISNNTNLSFYSDYNYGVVLEKNISDEIYADEIFYDYYVFKNVELDYGKYDIAIMHPKAWSKYFLFRLNPFMKSIDLDNGNVTIGNGINYVFKDGLVDVDGNNYSTQAFLEDTYKYPERQFIYNAIRDKNLYTETTTTLTAIKTNKFYFLNIKDDLYYIGKLKTTTQIKDNLKPYIALELTNIRDQYNRTYPDMKVVAKINPDEIRYLLLNEQNTLIKDTVSFYINDKYQQITDLVANVEGENSLSASNNKYVFVISKQLLMEVLYKNKPNDFVRFIADDVAINRNLTFKSIDYNKKQITLNNLDKDIEVPFLTEADSEYLIGNKKSKIFYKDAVKNLFGIELVNAPMRITLDKIPFYDLKTFLLMIKQIEPYDYLISEIKEDIANGSFSLKLEYLDVTLYIVYNIAKDKLYYINRTAQKATLDISKLDGALVHIKSVNEDVLKKFITTASIKEYNIKTYGCAIGVDNNINIYPFMVYETLKGPYYIPYAKPYFNLKNNIANNSSYQQGNSLREKFRGIYVDNETEVDAISLENDGIHVSLNVHGNEVSFVIKKGKTPKTYLNKTLQFETYQDDKVIIEGNNIKITNSIIGPMVKYSILGFYDLAIDVDILNKMIDEQSFLVNGNIFFVKGDDEYLLNKDSKTINIKDFEIKQTKQKKVVVDYSFKAEFVKIIEAYDVNYIEEYYVEVSDDGYIFRDSIMFSNYISI